MTQPLERDLTKILAMSDDDFQLWRERARAEMRTSDDRGLLALYMRSDTEFTKRTRAQVTQQGGTWL